MGIGTVTDKGLRLATNEELINHYKFLRDQYYDLEARYERLAKHHREHHRAQREARLKAEAERGNSA